MKRAALALTLVLMAMPASAEAVNVVEVTNNLFTPSQIRIARGETVTWVARDSGHTITADDGRFESPAKGTGVRGDTFTWTFTADETFAYQCRVHGPGMRGVVIVGAGSPRPPDPPQPPRRLVPSAEYPTLAHALDGAVPTTIIDLQPGTYRTSTFVTTPGVTIRGAGQGPADVVIDGDGTRAIGIDVHADGVRIENLTVRRHGIAGIVFDGVQGLDADRIAATDNGSFGIRIRNSRHGRVGAFSVSGTSSAGIAVQDCETCDIVIDAGIATGNAAGVLIQRAGAVTVTRSSFTGNTTGITLTGGVLEQQGAHVWGNHIVGTASAHAGIRIDGGSYGAIEQNTISGHRYGIVVTGIAGPSHHDRITGTIVSQSSIADLAWDGLGLNVCFSGNRRPDGSAASSAPPMAETIYSCALPHTVGIPWPLV